MEAPEEHLWELSANQLALLIQADEKIRLIDVREPHEYDICRIEGAELHPMMSLPAKLAEFSHDEYIIFYCHHGMRSAQVLNYFHQQGYRKISHLIGGINNWSLLVDSSVPRY